MKNSEVGYRDGVEKKKTSLGRIIHMVGDRTTLRADIEPCTCISVIVKERYSSNVKIPTPR